MHLISLIATQSGGMSEMQLGLLILVVIVAITAPRLLRRKQPSSDMPKSTRGREAYKEEARIRNTADTAIVGLSDTAREISAQIDTKIRILNKLVKDADYHASRLEKLHRLGSPEPQTDDRVKHEVPEKEIAVRPPAPRPSDNLDDLLGSKGSEDPVRSPSGRWRSDLHSRIATLLEQGKDAREIASLLRLSQTEVDLVVAMLDEKKQNP